MSVCQFHVIVLNGWSESLQFEFTVHHFQGLKAMA
jgi:hypothetical protein